MVLGFFCKNKFAFKKYTSHISLLLLSIISKRVNMSISLFLSYISTQKKYSAHTIKAYKTDIENFETYLINIYSINDVLLANKDIIRSWIAQLHQEGLSAKSIHRKASTLKSAFKYFQKQGIVVINPALAIPLPKIPKRITGFIAPSQMKKLSEVAFDSDLEKIRSYTITQLFYQCGLRLSELINLKETDINTHAGTLKVLGKGNKERIIPFGQELKQTLTQYLTEKHKNITNPSPFFFVTDSGNKLYPVWVQRQIKKTLSSDINTPQKNPHILRHTFATHLMAEGADINAVKELLGHSSLAATQIYTHNTIEQMKKTYSKAHPRSGK